LKAKVEEDDRVARLSFDHLEKCSDSADVTQLPIEAATELSKRAGKIGSILLADQIAFQLETRLLTSIVNVTSLNCKFEEVIDKTRFQIRRF
jgi:hypothetical protein